MAELLDRRELLKSLGWARWLPGRPVCRVRFPVGCRRRRPGDATPGGHSADRVFTRVARQRDHPAFRRDGNGQEVVQPEDIRLFSVLPRPEVVARTGYAPRFS